MANTSMSTRISTSWAQTGKSCLSDQRAVHRPPLHSAMPPSSQKQHPCSAYTALTGPRHHRAAPRRLRLDFDIVSQGHAGHAIVSARPVHVHAMQCQFRHSHCPNYHLVQVGCPMGIARPITGLVVERSLALALGIHHRDLSPIDHLRSGWPDLQTWACIDAADNDAPIAQRPFPP
jgi:hypothetical protein